MDPFTKGNDKKRGVDPLTFVIETGELCKAIDDDKKGRICALKPDDLNRLASNIRNDVNSCVLETLVDAIKGGRLKENQAAAYSYEPLTMIRTLLCLFKRPEDVYSQITKDDLAKLTDAEAENILYDVFQTIEKENQPFFDNLNSFTLWDHKVEIFNTSPSYTYSMQVENQ
jgi:hypothetical protein